MTVLSPFVFWAQNEASIFIKVDLKDVKEPYRNIESRRLTFQAKGVGARGLNEYQFSLDFHAEINVKDSTCKVTDNRVEFTLSKTEKAWWPRLITQSQKPIWLKIDHDRFQSEDMIDDDNEVNDIREAYPNLYEKLQKEEFGYKREDFKKVYLSLYNLFMYVGFMYIVCVLSVRYLRDGPDSFSGTYAAVGPAMCFLNLIQVLEVLHPLFGYVTGGVLLPLLQIGTKLFVLLLMLELEPRLQIMPVVFYLFMTWSSYEIIRYPYFMSQMLKKENGILTWLYHTLWTVSYPTAFVCEAVIIFRNLIFIEQDDAFYVKFTTPIEITLRFSLILRVYLLLLMIPSMYVIMSYKYKERKRKIGPKLAKKVKSN